MDEQRMTLFAPEEFFWGPKLVSTILTFNGLKFSCITGLELRSIERNEHFMILFSVRYLFEGKRYENCSNVL